MGEKTIQSLLGSHLCLDFVTTQDPRLGEHPREFLAGYADLIRWGVHTKLLTEERALELSE